MIRRVEDDQRLPLSTPAAEGEAASLSLPVAAQPGDPGFRPHLDAFAGPLDLLLYLIHKNEVDIFDIPITEILDQYLAHVRLLEEAGLLDLMEAGDFLVMAARLMEIKSRMLLPVPAAEEEGELLEEELVDPRHSLVLQLLEYKEIKERAMLLERVYEERGLQYARPPAEPPEEPQPHLLDLSHATMWDLAAAFQRMLSAADARGRVAVIEIEDRPQEEIIREIRQRLAAAPGEEMEFIQLFDPRLGRRPLIGYFLAVLEMLRLHLITVIQREDFGGILVRARGG